MATVVETFIEHVTEECDKHGVSVFLKETNFVRANGLECGGYFSEETKEIHVSMNVSQENWLGTLTHEYCHMLQWIEKCSEYEKFYITSNVDAGILIDMWLDNEIEFTDEQKSKYINAMIDIELDCEKRTVELIKKFGLPIKPRTYIKKANVYLRYLKVMAQQRKWTKKIITIARIWRKMPSNFKKLDYHKDASFEELALFEPVL